LAGKDRKPGEPTKNRGRRGDRGEERRVVGCPRCLLRQNNHRAMCERAAYARAARVIAVVARRRAVAVTGACMGAVKWAGDARLPSADTYDLRAICGGRSAVTHRLRGETPGVWAVHGHP
jgi:hypothetical protein